VAYLLFESAAGPVLVEVADDEVREGMIKAGVGERVATGVVRLQTALDEALTDVIKRNVSGFMTAVRSLEDQPDAFEVEFALKASGVIGNIAVGTIGGDCNYRVRLSWSRTSAPS
jgi:hypothetical protein